MISTAYNMDCMAYMASLRPHFVESHALTKAAVS